MRLNDSDFLALIDHGPLVSIDFIVRDGEGRVLTGLRTNRPAQGYWFVPGGRVRKDERLQDAIARLTETELGLSLDPDQMALKGVYEHQYEDNFFGEEGVTTHYVVIGVEISLRPGQQVDMRDQHAEHRWLTPQELIDDPDVHDNTKDYCRELPAGAALLCRA